MASRPQRKKQYLAQQGGKQKEHRQPTAEENHDAIEASVRKILPQIVQSVSVQEQSVHIGPLPPADEARKYQELCPDFVDRTLAITERSQKADVEIAKRGQIFQAMHSYSALLIAGGIVFAALCLAYKMQMAGHGILGSFVPFLGALATLISAFYGAKKLNERNNQQRKKRKED